MLRHFFVTLLVYQVYSNPLYRRDKKESVDPPASMEDALPIEQQPVLGEVPVDTATTTVTPIQTLPAEELKNEMKNVIVSQMVEENFDLEMAAPAKEDAREQLVDKLPAGQMIENIRKPAPGIEPAAGESPKLKVAEIITTTPVPTLAMPIDEINVAVDSRVAGQSLTIEELDNLESKNNEIVEMEEDVDLDGHSEILQPDDEKKPDLPCDKPRAGLEIGKPLVPGREGKTDRENTRASERDKCEKEKKLSSVEGFAHLSDEETFFRILAYLLSIFADPAVDEPSTWQKIIAGIQCVLRDCRDALPLRPTSSFPLDDNSFIIRRARESLCPCVVFDGKDG